MAPSKKTSARVMSEDAQRNATDDASAEDYGNNMFRDGNNRVAHIKNSAAYDNAAHTRDTQDAASYSQGDEAETLLDSNLDADDGSVPETLLALKQDTTRSRDGTDASGSLDESGGFLGGTTQEVDNLEATAAPVDKIPHMND